MSHFCLIHLGRNFTYELKQQKKSLPRAWKRHATQL